MNGSVTRVEAAILLASRLHRGQTRKGTDVPYLFHLLAVAALVAEHGGDEDQVVAALLHDAIEDAGGPAAREAIRQRFGDAVVALVDACTDAETVPKPPWRARKERFIARVTEAPSRVRLIVAADKLHNVDATLRDLRRVGEEVWNRFRGGRDGTLWYYEEMVRALARGWSHPILNDLRGAVEALRAEADRRGG